MKNKSKSPFAKGSPNHPYLILHSLIYAVILFLVLTSSACSTIRLQLNQLKPDKRSELPHDIKSAEEDADLAKESSCIITVNDDSGTFFMGKEQVAAAQLTGKIVEKLKGKTPDKRIVYIESSVVVKYQTVVNLLDLVRKADIEKVGLVVYKTNNEKAGARPHRIEVRLPSEPNDRIGREPLKPNPFVLVVFIDKTGAIFLDNEKMGDLNKTISLTKKLNDVFKERERNGVFREGTNEIEKTTFIKASQDLKYGDVIRVIDAAKVGGAYPIFLQLDDLND